MNESTEGKLLKIWLDQNWYKYSKIPSETYTPYFSVKKRNKDEWVKKGIPDYMIILKRNSLLFIELKKKKWPRWWMNGSEISEEQKEWVSLLSNIPNIEAKFAHWWREAVDIIIDQENL